MNLRQAIGEFLAFMLIFMGLVATVLATADRSPLAIDPSTSSGQAHSTGSGQAHRAAAGQPGEPSPAAPDMLFAPCPLGPRNIPIVTPGRTA
ncbi:MAG TPA: hypothetical protein VEC14_15010 [Reyranellaceae bacterium]|nr:hypothetical protein [Reyranellaceae bacterium]